MLRALALLQSPSLTPSLAPSSRAQPFPLNPTFNPLPPLADSIKSKIYNSYLHNILLKDATDSQVVRAVSTRFGVSMDRVRAIIRLKELEKQWKDEVRPLLRLLSLSLSLPERQE